MKKVPFVTKEQLDEIVKKYPTPFHLYDEKGIRENARKVYKAFSWNKGFKEYFAVKATPNPSILQIMKEEGCGLDCATKVELMMAKACGFTGHDVMFSSNVTPADEYAYAKDMGVIINFDDITHLKYFEENVGEFPETVCCRFNTGGDFKISTAIMDVPGEAKYGFTREQLTEGFKYLKSKGVKHFGIHAFLASNTKTNDYYPALAKILFKTAVELHEETGADIKFINLSGGVGVAYSPDETPNDIEVIGEGVHKVYDEILVPAGMGDVAIFTEMGRFMLAPYGHQMCIRDSSMTFNVTKKPGDDKLVLNAILNQRSQDVLAANNWNVVQYSVLMHMLAQVCDMQVGELVHVIADAHIYDRHIPLIEELISRETHPAPTFKLNPEIKNFYDFTTKDIMIENYVTGPQIKNIPIAV